MNPIDKKKCADLLREMCTNVKKKPHYSDVRQQVNELIKYADKLWPPDKNAYTETQWEGLKRGLHWNGTPEELEAGLDEMKARNRMSDVGGRKSETPEIAI